MDNIFQNTNGWVTELGEIFHKYLSATVNFVTDTIQVNYSDLTNVIKPSDYFLSDVNDLFKQLSELLAFDYFQWQLLKIFLSILMTLVFMIFCAWYVYGVRISERFMESGHKIDERNNYKYHSPRF